MAADRRLGARDAVVVHAVHGLEPHAWRAGTDCMVGEDAERRGAMQRYLAEAVGTFVLVFGGCGSAVLAGDKIGFLGVSFAFGLSLLAMVYAIGPISGCHINPAVTVGLLLSKKFDARYAVGYIVA
jgi:hypothetical protein